MESVWSVLNMSGNLSELSLQTVKILSVYVSCSNLSSSSGNITYSWMVGWNDDSRLTCRRGSMLD